MFPLPGPMYCGAHLTPLYLIPNNKNRVRVLRARQPLGGSCRWKSQISKQEEDACAPCSSMLAAFISKTLEIRQPLDEIDPPCLALEMVSL